MNLLSKRLSRRTVLRGAGGVVIGLPLLEAMRPLRRAHAAPAPKKFVVFFSPNGTIAPAWEPTLGPSGAETDFTLSPILQPLAPFQQDIVVIQGVDQQGGGGDGHQNGIGGMLTGASLNPGPFQGGGGSAPAGWASSISVDQRIAAVNGLGTRFRSLELGVQVGSADNWGRMSYLGGDRPVPPESDPSRAYARVFSDLNTDPTVLARIRARRKSVLDAVSDQYGAVVARLGGEDRQKLDAHATSIREIESRLDVSGATAPGCTAPAVPPSTLDMNLNDNFPAVGELQMDLLVMALTCGLTRVASLQWSRSVSQVRFTWLGITDAHHDLSHLGDDDADAVDKLTRINNWYAARYASLLDRMKRVDNGDGTTLLDSSLVFWCNELAKGNNHTRTNAPYVLGGKAGGALRTGRYLRYDDGDMPHNNLLVSMLNAMDVPDTRFGKAEWCTGALPNLL
jgi:hypothetical protein